ncbi:MAG TPA: flavin reductase family protein [Gemmatimonadales bacterium]|nr:flavin reductase family protein [Gemmatimonadales bacterium]
MTKDADPADFRRLLGHFATGVTVLTTRAPGGGPAGMTVNSLASVSLLPPLLSVSIDRTADVHDVLVHASRFVVNILDAGQEGLSRRFAQSESDRFAGVGWHPSTDGEPVLDGALAHIECEHFAVHPGGDHTILVGRVTGGATRGGSPLLYYRGGYTGLGPG